MKRIVLRLLRLYSILKNRQVSGDNHYFIRDNYYARLLQTKYVVKDTVVKTPYKVIEYHGEFQQELLFVLPFAYWHHLNGTLLRTASCTNTRELYFFSPSHQEKFAEREWESNDESYEIPNMTHCNSFDYRKWAPVPLKATYQNEVFVYEKPILVIANKFNIEWGQPPINYFSIEVLDTLIATLSGKYQILYNRPSASSIVLDNSEILELNEHDWLRKQHPEVLLMEDLYQEHRASVNSFNHFQLLVYANASAFISVHGGTATLASYFGGKNIIFSKRGVEHALQEFTTIFPKLSGATIYHAKTEAELLAYAEQHY
ncbi:hypothetical protein [Hymenobacter wooponensis]|uniref:Glycosyltransferase family 61 protein n=1 Tax=Hymenobacter wooponensis TaxID=1525360 RepID=A0A4Z0MJI7_9BACT|nr:hypothetical protein [Hymenobacter wooponensis]TGD79629.1 hypothetical protein EU557_15535 [Hymenobacter wooponensis]